MAREDNLIPQAHVLTVDDQSKGGKKSAEVRRVRKSFKESFIDELSNGKSQYEIVKAVLEKAMQGDIQSAVFIRDTIGEKPTDKVEQNGKTEMTIKVEGDVLEWSK
jgi:hypothetical protein